MNSNLFLYRSCSLGFIMMFSLFGALGIVVSKLSAGDGEAPSAGGSGADAMSSRNGSITLSKCGGRATTQLPMCTIATSSIANSIAKPSCPRICRNDDPMTHVCCPSRCADGPPSWSNPAWVGVTGPVQVCTGVSKARQMAPTLFIIGSAKAGTTSLWSSLLWHPRLHATEKHQRGDRAETVKELTFWGTRDNAKRGLQWYLNHFRACGNSTGHRSIDASPGYLHYALAPAQISRSYEADAVRTLRFVVLLRNPIDRLVSWHRFVRTFVDPRVGLQKQNESCACNWTCASHERWPFSCSEAWRCLGFEAFASQLLAHRPDRARLYFDADMTGLRNWLTYFAPSAFFVAAFEELQVRVRACVCACACVCVRAFACACMHVRMRARARRCACACACACACVRVRISDGSYGSDGSDGSDGDDGDDGDDGEWLQGCGQGGVRVYLLCITYHWISPYSSLVLTGGMDSPRLMLQGRQVVEIAQRVVHWLGLPPSRMKARHSNAGHNSVATCPPTPLDNDALEAALAQAAAPGTRRLWRLIVEHGLGTNATASHVQSWLTPRPSTPRRHVCGVLSKRPQNR